ncbi:MAG: D-alanine--D-alanine ligase [Candidatus Aminicenantes bacterium]|nr:D-alanine--D-alanine ligase [Candidatus Aminicenantes bacterium]
MKIALLYSSKAGCEAALATRKADPEGDEPPLDQLAECDTDETIDAVSAVLRERHQVVPIEADEKAYGRLRRAKPALVFNIAERLTGPNRESHIPTICEILEIPYTGSDPLTLSLCLDKARAKEILAYHKVPTPEFWVVESSDGIPAAVRLPAIVKPLHEGSSMGIKNNSLVGTPLELEERVDEVIDTYRQPAIVERFLAGREFTVGVLGNRPGREVLPIVEIDHGELPTGAAPIYSYEAKWVWDRPEKPLEIFLCPAHIDATLRRRIEQAVVRTCDILRVRDWCRIDVRLDERGVPNILEVNPLPGILPKPEDNSCLPKAARTAGYSYSDLIHRVVEAASARCGLRTLPVRPALGPAAVAHGGRP